MNADKMKTPLLLVHGEADNNPKHIPPLKIRANKNGYFTKGSAQLCSQRKHLASLWNKISF
jgi:hypothetical protein